MTQNPEPDTAARRMRMVVTGASGNVGTPLVRRLLADGHEVVGVCRRIPPDTPPYSGAQWHRVDLSYARAEDLVEIFRGADAVIHLAWGFQPTRDVDHHRRLGVGGTAAVVEACRLAGVPHLVHQSSVGAYAPVSDGGPGVSMATRVSEGAELGGVPTAAYNHHKTAAEHLLDQHEREHPDTPTIARMRAAFIVHGEAASGLVRYFSPAFAPIRLIRALPFLPVDRRLTVPLVHGDDMASALAAAATTGARGAFNIAAEPPITRDMIARELGARPVELPFRVLRQLAHLTWLLRLQPVSIGWVDLAFGVPLMHTTRARAELGWHPTVSADEALREVIDAIAAGRAGTSPPLRPRTLLDAVTSLRRGGAVDVRRLP